MAAVFKNAWPYKDDAMNLPVKSLADAIPFYETVLGFHLVSRTEENVKRAVLARDQIQIALAENGGDPSQEGCFFEVDNVQEAFDEFQSRGLNKQEPGFRVDKHGATFWRVFFVVAPDGLCYCLGERQS